MNYEIIRNKLHRDGSPLLTIGSKVKITWRGHSKYDQKFYGLVGYITRVVYSDWQGDWIYQVKFRDKQQEALFHWTKIQLEVIDFKYRII